jgi:hypothetical protein
MITQEQFDKLLPGDTVIAWDAFRPNGALAVVAARDTAGWLWLDWEGKGTGKSCRYRVEHILSIVPRSITDTQRLDWLINAVFTCWITEDNGSRIGSAVVLELIGIGEEELYDVNRGALPELFRAAIDRRLTKTPEAAG